MAEVVGGEFNGSLFPQQEVCWGLRSTAIVVEENEADLTDAIYLSRAL